jgi:hypothetical protein
MYLEKILLETRVLRADGRYEKNDLAKEQLEELKREGVPI